MLNHIKAKDKLSQFPTFYIILNDSEHVQNSGVFKGCIITFSYFN